MFMTIFDPGGVVFTSQVLEMGIETYNRHCRSIVTRYSKEWERTIKRLGRWIDFENDYKTMVREGGITPCRSSLAYVYVSAAVPTSFRLLVAHCIEQLHLVFTHTHTLDFTVAAP